ncbi:hypothetical protein ACFLXC_05455 [Chloroflexota bacterium]
MNMFHNEVTGFYRKVLNNERKFLFTPMANISIAAHLNGRVDEDTLRRAIDKVRIIHPLAAARVVIDSDRSVCFHIDNVPEIPLRVVERQTDSQWFEEVWHEQQIPFDQLTGPLLRFVLIKSPQISDLVVFAQHGICDGTGLAYLMRDVLVHLGSPEMKSEPLPSSLLLTPGNLPHGIRENPVVKLLRKIYSRQLNNKWRKNPFFFDVEDFHAIHDAFFENYTYHLVTMELSATETEELITTCRKQNVSVNSSLTTACIAAYNDVVAPLQGNKRKVAIPMDMRKRLGRDVGDVLDLYVGTVMFDYNYDTRKSFWDNTRVFHRMAHQKMESMACFQVMYQMEDIDGTLMDILLGFGTMSKLVQSGTSRYEKLSSFAKDQKNAANQLAARFIKALPGVINTNLANMNFPERYGEIELERMYFAPATGPDYPLVIGVITTSGRLTLTLNHMEETVSTQTMSAIRNRALSFLGLAESGL